MLQDQYCGSTQRHATFGRRKVVPRVCVVDAKSHIRLFLRDALEDLGFITGECDRLDAVAGAFEAQTPDIVVFGSSLQAAEAAHILNLLAAGTFDGWILLVAPRDSLTVAVVEELSNALHIAKLPTLFTPFADKQLRDCVAPLIPAAPPIDIPVDVGEALHAGWLELWYQPKIDTHTCCLRGAEALVRIRHPSWGIVPPAYFIPDDGDPHFRALSEFVISQALDDWRSIVHRHGPVEMAINLPISFLQDPLSIRRLCEKLPEHPAAEGLVIEINGTEVVRHFDLLKQMAKQLQFYRVAISIDDVGAEWPSLAGLRDFPFVEIKVDRKFITGCADDQLKQAVCRRILALADSYGARTVAEGVESRDDLQAVREMDFDLVQGFFFGRPMPAEKFVKRT